MIPVDGRGQGITDGVAPSGALSRLPAHAQQTITGHEFFPNLISGPFHDGLMIVFAVSAGLSVFAGLASLLRGGRYVDSGELPRPHTRPVPQIPR